MSSTAAIGSPPDSNQKVNSLHFDLGGGHNNVMETDSIEGSVVFDDVCASPGMSKGGQRSGAPARNFEDNLRTQDVMAISALISSLQSSVDDFVAGIKEFCQRHAVPCKKETVQLNTSGNTRQPTSEAAGGSPASSTSTHVTAEVIALQNAIKSEIRFAKNEPLLDLASYIDSFFVQSATLREASRRITQRLTNRHVTTQSFAHLGNSRFTCTYLNLAQAANSATTSGQQSGFASPARMSMIHKPRIGTHMAAATSDVQSSPISSLIPRPSNLHSRGKQVVSVQSPTSAARAGHHNESDCFGGSMDLDVPKKDGSLSIQQLPLNRCNESNVSFQSLTTGSIAGQPQQATETAVLDVTRDTEGNKLINEYIVIGELGRGSFGKVKLAEHKQNKDLYAIKILNKSMLRKVRNGMTSAIQQVQTEIAVMKKLRHRNIVNLYEVIDDPNSNKMYLVMQYVSNGPVLKMNTDGTCPKLDDGVARDYAKQLAAGLNYLHRHNVIHRDIKPDNILLGSNGSIFLSDFGVSEILDEDTDFIVGSQGTPAFMSPELCRGEGGVHGKAVDMWALGITLYAFVCGKLPFFGSSFDEISQKVQNSALEFPPSLDDEWVELLSGLLNKDPKRRMTASELRQSPLLYGGGDAMAQSRRGSAIDVVFVDEEDIENAIAVGNQVQLCCHRTPREKLHEYVQGVQKRVALQQSVIAQLKAAQENAVSSMVQLSVDTVENSQTSFAPLSPHPPSSSDDFLGVKSPPQRPVTREGSLTQIPAPPARLDSGSTNNLAPPDFNSPKNATTGAKLRASALASPNKSGD